jgi:ADP-ribose pyrophosphatase YjhB (NUDIX family)
MIELNPLIVEEGIDLNSNYQKRKTVRGIIMNGEQHILLAYSPFFQDYTFPGGGVRTGETEIEALKRELKEEIGAIDIDIIKPLFRLTELKYGLNDNGHIYLQTSIYYHVIVNQFGEQELMGREVKHGIHPVWIAPDEAIKQNRAVLTDQNHQQKGLKTVLIRENRVLTYLKENSIHA